MNVRVAEEDLVGIVELLSFVADLCECEAFVVGIALERHVGCRGWNAAELADGALTVADQLARAMGFPDADMDPDKDSPRMAR